jgi:DNA-binding response OmpR family regulator
MKQRILIIDDEPNIRRMMRLALEMDGYEIGEAQDGPAGLQLFGDGAGWDAVVLDERMPGMDGLEVLRRIKEREPEARVIMVTAYASIELAVDAMKLGAKDFVRKPTTPEVLRGALQAALAKEKHPESRATAREIEPARPIQTLTLNGFEIVRYTAPELSKPLQSDEHTFLVKSPGGKSSRVIVKIDPSAVGYVERLTGRHLPASNSFWTQRAERMLADYLWSEGKVPPDGRLVVKAVGRAELLLASRWE